MRYDRNSEMVVYLLIHVHMCPVGDTPLDLRSRSRSGSADRHLFAHSQFEVRWRLWVWGPRLLTGCSLRDEADGDVLTRLEVDGEVGLLSRLGEGDERLDYPFVVVRRGFGARRGPELQNVLDWLRHPGFCAHEDQLVQFFAGVGEFNPGHAGLKVRKVPEGVVDTLDAGLVPGALSIEERGNRLGQVRREQPVQLLEFRSLNEVAEGLPSLAYSGPYLA